MIDGDDRDHRQNTCLEGTFPIAFHAGLLVTPEVISLPGWLAGHLHLAGTRSLRKSTSINGLASPLSWSQVATPAQMLDARFLDAVDNPDASNAASLDAPLPTT